MESDISEWKPPEAKGTEGSKKVTDKKSSSGSEGNIFSKIKSIIRPKAEVQLENYTEAHLEEEEKPIFDPVKKVWVFKNPLQEE